MVELRTLPRWAAGGTVAALFERCRPLAYRAIRHRLAAAADAEDLTQSFFVNVLAKSSLGMARLGSGCFRPYLLAALRHHVSNERARASTRKRGGGVRFVPLEETSLLDAVSATSAGLEGPDDHLDGLARERAWNDAIRRLCEEMRGAAARRRATALLRHVLDEDGDRAYPWLARELGTSVGAARVALHRARRRLAGLLAPEPGGRGPARR